MKVHVDWPRGAAPKPEDIAAAAATTASTGPAQIQALAAILAESNAAPNGG